MKMLLLKIKDMKNHSKFLLLVSVVLFYKIILIANIDTVNPDGVRYANAAYQLLQGNIAAAFAHEKMLVYVGLLGIFNACIGDWVLSGQVISVLFLTLTLFPVYFLARDLFGCVAGLWAVAAFGLLPSVNGLVGNVVKDAPFLFLMASALFVGHRALLTQGYSRFFLAFGCTVAAASFRLEGLVFLGVYACWLIYLLRTVPESRKSYCQGLVVFVGVPLAFALALGVVVKLSAGAGSLAASVWPVFSVHYLGTDLFDSYRQIYQHMKTAEGLFPGGQWTNDFFEIARHNLPLIYLLGLLQTLISALFTPYLIPLYLGVKETLSRDRATGLLFSAVVAYAGMAYFFIMTRNFLAERYLLVVVVLLLPLIGHGFERMHGRIASSRYPRALGVAAILLFICLPLYKSFADTLDDKREIRLAGEWLRDHRDPVRQGLIAGDERIPFYAGLMRGSYELLPGQGVDDFAAFARERGSALLVIDLSPREAVNNPNLSGYRLVKEFRGKGRVVLIFEAVANR